MVHKDQRFHPVRTSFSEWHAVYDTSVSLHINVLFSVRPFKVRKNTVPTFVLQQRGGG